MQLGKMNHSIHYELFIIELFIGPNTGNEYCRRVWLALYDPQLGLEPDSKDGEKIKDFMAQKYEKKRFYVAPTESVREAAKQANMTAASVAASATPRQG